MPIYEYYCSLCDKTFERFHNMNFKGEFKCDKCQKVIERILSSSYVYPNGFKYKEK
jgi:putative FmdB family regulatory protein